MSGALRGSFEGAAGASSGERPGTALFLSPHLDDAVFSCGGTLTLLARRGWRTVLLTAFTRSVPDPRGFALACQLDKGLPPEADYMHLRRKEDRRAADILGAGEVVHLDLAEAPHRGYESAAALFAGVREEDEVWRPLAEELAGELERLGPRLVFAPQGLGSHVDHRQGIRALLLALERVRRERAAREPEVLWYRDTPYALRRPGALPPDPLPTGALERAVRVDAELEAKLAASAAYTTQVPFQFGPEVGLRAALWRFATEESARLGEVGAAEVFLTTPGTELLESPGGSGRA